MALVVSPQNSICTKPRVQAQCVFTRAVHASRWRVVPLASNNQDAATAAADPIPSRRHALLAAATLVAVAVPSAAHAPIAAAEAACAELIDTPSGLKYCEIQEGDGNEPVKGALIRAHYTGRLASNGKVFDSSYPRGRPLTFKVGVREVIPGWDLGILGAEGIPPMKEGGKRLLVIPSDLAYGDRGAGGVIPPKATLEFEVELLGKRR